MNVLLPNCNNPFKDIRYYKSVSGLKSYANKHNILLTEVTDLSDINKLLRCHHIDYVYIDRVFIGW